MSDIDELDNEDRSRVLGIIDDLRTLGINEEISLPQLVVVGDQSSGKSSLLEGLTGLHFPIASELCTRFATQIVLRRSDGAAASVRVSILPGRSSSTDDAHRTHLESFMRVLEGAELSADDFANILDEASVHMGLPTGRESDFEELPKRFSDDILKIEMIGPEHHHLSVVDVPGLFHNPTKYQTQEDLNIIRGLLEGYMEDKRTIILAVMDGRNNLANQEIFRMARIADPGGKRTVGIITKCDALQPGDENMVLKIAQNQIERLTHGWFCVKNRSTQDIQNGVTIAQRHVNERTFFATSPWNNLPRERVGLHSLKSFLGKLLYDHIKEEFPALVQELRQIVNSCRAAMEDLGPSRQTVEEQRQYLQRIASQYQQMVEKCLRGDYDSSWKPNDPRKLRMQVHKLNDLFSDKLARKGCSRRFRTTDDKIDHDYNGDSGFESGTDESDEPDGNIYDWLRSQYLESRGAELPGMINPALMKSLFRQQALKWWTFANDHLEAIEKAVVEFNAVCFETVFTDETVRRRLHAHNSSVSTESRARAFSQLSSLWKDETEGILQTANHYYAENLNKAKADRFVARLKRLGIRDNANNIINYATLTSHVHLSNTDQAVFDIHDMLKAYYKVARKRFCDNVVLQVIERCYLLGDGPVSAISPTYVSYLTNDDLGAIAGENSNTTSLRNETAARLQRLEKALRIAEAELRRH